MLRPSNTVTRGPEPVIGAPNAVIPSNARDLGFCSTRTTPIKETMLPGFAREDKTVYDAFMRYSLRFLWNATKGHRLAPWRSPYLLWRIETYCGLKMTQIGFLEFWEFLWRERTSLWRFLKWTAEMERYAHPKPKNP
jgi:hypothetical protein